MAASTTGALKAFIEAQNLNITVFRDQAPLTQNKPYIVVHEAVSIVPDMVEDGAAGTVREEVTIEVWMAWKSTTLSRSARAESYTLPAAVARVLEGARLTVIGASTVVYAVLVRYVGPRLVEDEENTIRVPIQADVMRLM